MRYIVVLFQQTASATNAESTSSTSVLTAGQSQTQAVAAGEDASSGSAAAEDGNVSAPAAARDGACDSEKDGDETVIMEEKQEDARLTSEADTAAGQDWLQEVEYLVSVLGNV